jgi:xylulose-5-phosphate/fructose-6-phosphate phosphoketolase
MDSNKLLSFDRYLRAANYLAGAQLYLQENVLLKEPLEPSHIKPRLLGHWGTCPGINLLYTCLNRMILLEERKILLITGPGHGAPANLANIYLEGTLREYYPDLGHNEKRSEKFCEGFFLAGRISQSPLSGCARYDS